jgi:hypothetical protein
MNRSSKTVSLLILTLLASNILTIEPTNAQTIPKPSVPEFTLKYIDYSYDVPPTYKINEYTGEKVATSGYHVKNMTIQVSVKNNPLPSNDATSHLYYNVRFKGHFGKDWSETPSVENKNSSPSNFSQYVNILPYNSRLLEQTSSEFTTFLFSANDYIPNSSIDFQVEAVLGHDAQAWVPPDPFGESPAQYYEAVAFDETSGWSNTQSITIPDNSVPSSSQQYTNLALVAAVAVSIVVVISLLLYRRHRKTAMSRNFDFP